MENFAGIVFLAFILFVSGFMVGGVWRDHMQRSFFFEGRYEVVETRDDDLVCRHLIYKDKLVRTRCNR
jgi:hypothetical protein